MRLPILFMILTCGISAFGQSRMSTTLGFDYFSTKQNYADDGSGPESLPGNNSYSNLQMILEANWKPNKIWGYEAGFVMARAESVSTTLKRDNLNPSKIYGGVRPRLYSGNFEFFGLARAYYSLTQVDMSTSNVLLGEGENGIDLGGEIYKRFRPGVFRAEAYMHYPDQERAVLLPFELSWTGMIASRHSLRGRFFGETGLVNDKFTNDKLQRRAVTDYVNGGSYRYYSVNPSFYSVGIDLLWRLDRQSLATFGLATTLTGKSSAVGTSLLASYTWIWGTTERGSVEFIDRSEERAKKKEQDFRPNSEDSEYDESLFKD